MGDHSSALGFSPHLPVSVCGTVIAILPEGDFPGTGFKQFALLLAELLPYGNFLIQKEDALPLMRLSKVQASGNGAGILTCFPSTTPFGLALGPANPE